MTQQLFDELTAGAPPSTVDVSAIVRREKRRRIVLRSTGSATVVLALAGALAMLGLHRAAEPAPPVVAAPSPAESTVPVAPGFRLIATDRAATAATAASLRAALDAAVHRFAPGAAWLARGRIEPGTADGRPPWLIVDDPERAADRMFWGATGITLDGRLGTLTLSVAAIDACSGGRLAKCPDEHKDPETRRREMAKEVFACRPAAQKCTASTRPDGRRQRVQKMVSPHGFISQQTNLELADGRVLMILVDNTYIAPEDRNETIVAQLATPLTAAQITAIATAIGDRILP